MATVYGIVQQSGGHVRVTSKLGSGATFEVYLPQSEEEPAPPAASPTSEENLSGWETVLLVEDAEPLRLLTKETLEKHGYRVLEAGTGAEAIRLAAQYLAPIDLLLTDVVLPGMDGRQLADSLVALRPGMKVLYISGYADSTLAGRGVLASGANFLHKPFQLDALARRVRQVLDAGQPTARSS